MLYSIILPTYNERENLPIIFYLINQTFESIKGEDNEDDVDFEVVIVDDASPDRTLEVAESLQKSYGHGHITIVSRSGKLGLGTAYIAGLQKAKGQRIILMDADLSHHPKFIVDMIRTMNVTGCDVVSGTRYRPGGGVAGWDLKRKVTSKGANILADILLNPYGCSSDLTGSFRLYTRTAIETILPRVQCTGYAFQMEIMVLASKTFHYNIQEVPITFVDRIYGESKLGTKEIVLYLKGLVTLFFTT